MRLRDALDAFVLQLQADGRSEHTIGNYERHIALLARWLGELEEIEAITPTVLARFLTSDVARVDVRRAPRKAATVNALRTSLRVFFGWQHDAGLLATNPARLVRRAVCSPPPPKTLTDEEIGRLLAAVARDPTPEGKRDHAMFGLMLASGVRLSSAIGIDIEDVDLAREEILLRRSKRDRTERLLIGRATAAMLSSYIGERSEGPLFRAMHGRALGRRQAARRLEQWLERAGVERRAGAHALRHSFATRLYLQTGDVFVVKRALGHASIQSTLVYARPDEGRLRAALS